MKKSKIFVLAVMTVLLIVPMAIAQTDESIQITRPKPKLKAVTNAAGTGTLNTVSKWTETGGAGTLGDSTIVDTGTMLGFGTTSPGAQFDFVRNSASDVLMRMWNQGTGGSKLRYVAAVGATSQLQLTDLNEWLMSIAGNNAIGMQFRVRAGGPPNSEAALDASARMTILRNGNVGIGTTAPASLLHVAGNIQVDGNIAAKYQDVAEWVPVTEPVTAGTVVVLNPARANEVMPSSTAYDSRIVGVVSHQPGLILGEASDKKAMVANIGRVRVMVDATKHPVAIGDLLVTSDTPGTAMVSIPVDVGGIKIHRPGTIIGKALEALPNGKGEILVLLSLQ